MLDLSNAVSSSYQATCTRVDRHDRRSRPVVFRVISGDAELVTMFKLSPKTISIAVAFISAAMFVVQTSMNPFFFNRSNFVLEVVAAGKPDSCTIRARLTLVAVCAPLLFYI